MISFIDEHRGVFGVEPICRLLPIAPSTYFENVAKRLDVDRLSVRARSDIGLKIEIRRVCNETFQVYGVRKVWRQLQREGFDIARCTVARLMRAMGLQGIIHGKPIRTTISDKAAPCPLDRVNRQFFAPAPNICGYPISPMSRPGRASSTWPRDKCCAFALMSSMPLHAALSVGEQAGPHMRASSSMLSTWRFMIGGPSIAVG
ncbi:HTH-like domain-containing protein [Rhizobium sp. RU36D]|nr:HTH-like domain-containing protein [Rhizobium sp. RU36D]